MKLYYYDEKGYFTTTSPAFLDPLETEMQGKDVWLIPPSATTIEPPSSADGHIIKFNGKTWELEKMPDPEPEPELTLEELKAQKLKLVDAWTADKITGGFISQCTGKPVTYDSDKDTQLTMQGIALNVGSEQFAQKYPTGCPVRGYAAGQDAKSVFMLTPEQVLSWQADLSTHIGTCKQAGWAKQAEVNAATTKDELDSIDVEVLSDGV